MANRSSHIVIVQPPRSESGAVLARGTKVVTEDGHEITGVTKVTLIAEAGDVWRAVIECVPHLSGDLIASLPGLDVVVSESEDGMPGLCGAQGVDKEVDADSL